MFTNVSPGLTYFLHKKRGTGQFPEIVAQNTLSSNFCFLQSSCLALSLWLHRSQQSYAFISGGFQWTYPFVHLQGCGIGGLRFSNKSFTRSVYPDRTSCTALSKWTPRGFVELLWETACVQVLLFMCFAFLRLCELLQSVYKCLGWLSCYITNPLPFKCFPDHTPLVIDDASFFHHFLNIRKELFWPKNPHIITELPLWFTVEGTPCAFKHFPSRCQINWQHLPQTIEPCE